MNVAEIVRIYPLTPVQQGMLFHVLAEPESGVYLTQAEFLVRGSVDPAMFRRCWEALTARHDALRTAVVWEELDQPLQVVYRHVEPPFDHHDWRDVPASSQRERREALRQAQRGQGFQLAQAPLFRLVLTRLADELYSFVWTNSHLVTDGWSSGTLIHELSTLYRGLSDGDQPRLDPVRPYEDYVAWLGNRDQTATEAHWRRALEGFGAATPLGVDRHDHEAGRDPQTEYHREHSLRLSPERTTALTTFARRHRLTLSTVIQGAWALLLSRYSGCEDVAFGVTISGRPIDLEGADSIVGPFINTLPVRMRISGDRNLVPWLTGLQQQVTELQQFQHSSLGDVQRWSAVAAGEPLFESIVVFENYPIVETVDDEVLRLENVGVSERTNYPLSVVVIPDAALLIKLAYQGSRFAPDVIERMGRHLQNLLTAFLEHSDARLSELRLESAEERHQTVVEWNATAAEFPADTTLSERFEAQVEHNSDAVAVVHEDGELSYRELNAKANALAHTLRSFGVGPETIVAVCVERSPRVVIALLAIVKAGGAYLPLDPDYPAERLRFMLRDSGTALVLTTESLREQVPEGAARRLWLDADSAMIGRAPSSNPTPTATADSLVYVIYTSGSTGRPKGVPNTHRAICNRLDWMQKRYGLAGDDRVLQKTPLSFDVSVWELFWPLLNGATLVLALPGGHKDPTYLRELITRRRVTTVHFVPSMLTAFLAEERVERCQSLRRVICSGEELPHASATRFFERLDCELHNLYGPTEAAIDVSSWQCTPERLHELASVPIGRPIQNLTLYVCDAEREPVPVGLAGELHIGGVGLARGYLNRPGLTAERFVPDPFARDGSRLYRTGDLTRFRPDGEIEFLGRIDSQVKIRGQRIELGEIEAVLRAQGGVVDAAVLAREDSPGDKRLVAYVVAQNHGAMLSLAQLRNALRLSLPDYMVPSGFVVLDALPLSPNGKLDRSALPAPEAQREVVEELVEPRTALERAVADVWRDVLGIERIGIDDNFFDLGGHSLVATKLIGRLQRVTPGDARPTTVMDLFKQPTVRALAALLELPQDQREAGGLLHELTEPISPHERVLSFVCIPQGGASAIVYQPLADALPEGNSLYAVAMPGHDPGLPDEQRQPIAEVAQACVAEILERVEGPLALYGHCAGSALTVELAHQLQAAGRKIEAAYIGGDFPTARPPGFLGRLAHIARLDSLLGDRSYLNYLKAIGEDVEGLEPAQAEFIVGGMRHDADLALDYYTRLLERETEPLAAPIVSIVGGRDPLTEYHEERYKEWHRLTDSTAVAVIDEAAHFFQKHRASELAEIVTSLQLRRVAAGERPSVDAPCGGAGWWLEGVSSVRDPLSAGREGASTPQPSLARFFTVAGLQLVSILGSALTAFALPLWVYLETGSVAKLGLLAALELAPGLLVTPLAGVVIDRSNRRTVMIASDLAAGLVMGVLAILYLAGSLSVLELAVGLPFLSIAAAFQVLAYTSAIPQLVPKHYLGHANGIVQLAAGSAEFVVPLIGAALLASIGLGAIFAIDMATFMFSVAVLSLLRFPESMPHTRRESIGSEIANGLRYTIGHRGIRGMLLYFALLNLGLASLVLLIPPLVLSFASLSTVAQVSVAGGAGAVLGGLTLGIWGGPAHRRMLGMLSAALMLGLFAFLAGLRPSALLVAVAVFGILYWLAIVNGIYLTIVQVKVPQRLHGRVLALNLLVAWSTIPLAQAVVAPLAADLFQPLLEPGGLLAPTVGELIGVGDGRGIALVFIVFALLMVMLTLAALAHPTLARFDRDYPDAEPDDLLGLEETRRKRGHAPIERS